MEQRSNCSIFLLVPFLALVHGTLLESPVTRSLPSKHFVLIHGSCHGAWSWYKIVALLKSSGHNVTAIDLAASGVDPQPVSTVRSVSEYNRPFLEFMESLPGNEKVILVGHSLGGLAISQAMEMFPDKVSVAVFVTALMPGPSLNITTLNQEALFWTARYTFDDGPDNPPTTLTFGSLYLASNVYQHSPTKDWALATTLMRPLRLFSQEDLSKQLVLTSRKYGSVKQAFVISEKDKVMDKDFQQWMTQKNSPDEVICILGSDHMVMMSKPKELWSHLLEIAAS